MSLGKTPSTMTQTNKTELSPEQSQMFNLAMPFMQQYASSPLTMPQGPTLAGFDPSEIAGQVSGLGAAGAGGALGNQARQSNMWLMSPDQLNPATNPYISNIGDIMTGQITDKLQQQILPGIRSGGQVAGGMYSGANTRDVMAENLAVQGSSREMGSALEKLYMDNYQSGVNTMGQAINRNPSVQEQGLFEANTLAGVGGQRRAMEQAGYDENIRRQLAEMNLPFTRASDIMGLMTGMPGGQGTSTVQGIKPNVAPWMQGAGGAMAGLAALLSLIPGGQIPAAGLGLAGAGMKAAPTSWF